MVAQWGKMNERERWNMRRQKNTGERGIDYIQRRVGLHGAQTTYEDKNLIRIYTL